MGKEGDSTLLIKLLNIYAETQKKIHFSFKKQLSMILLH